MKHIILILAILLSACSKGFRSDIRTDGNNKNSRRTTPDTPPAVTEFPEKEIEIDFNSLAAPYVDRFTPDPNLTFQEFSVTRASLLSCLDRPVLTSGHYVKAQEIGEFKLNSSHTSTTLVSKHGDDGLKVVDHINGLPNTETTSALKENGEEDYSRRSFLHHPGPGAPYEVWYDCKDAETAYDSHWRGTKGKLRLKDGSEILVTRYSYGFKGNAVCKGHELPEKKFENITAIYVLFVSQGFGPPESPCGPWAHVLSHRELRQSDGKLLTLRHSEITGRQQN